MYNYYRDKRNDHYAVIAGLAAGWAVDVWLDYSTATAVMFAFGIGMVFRLGVWISPWSEKIPLSSDEHINSTPWQPMRSLDELRFATDSEYAEQCSGDAR